MAQNKLPKLSGKNQKHLEMPFTKLLSSQSNIRQQASVAQAQIQALRSRGLTQDADYFEKQITAQIQNRDSAVVGTMSGLNSIFEATLKQPPKAEDKKESMYSDTGSASEGIMSAINLYSDLGVNLPASLVQDAEIASISNDLEYQNRIAKRIEEFGGVLLEAKTRREEEKPSAIEEKEAVIARARKLYEEGKLAEAASLMNAAGGKGILGVFAIGDLPSVFGENAIGQVPPPPERIPLSDILQQNEENK